MRRSRCRPSRTSTMCRWHTCRPNFYRVMLYVMHSSHRIFLTHDISKLAWDRHTPLLERKIGNRVFYRMTPFLMTFDDPHTIYRIFTAWRYASTVYILSYGPVFIRLFIWLWAGGLHDAKLCRGTRVATSLSMLPLVTDALQWCGLSIHPRCLLLLQLWGNNQVANV